MTEFKQQVAAALRDAALTAPRMHDATDYPDTLLNHLAPRVAAAILAAGQTARARGDAFAPL
jgi:hypothetical protein